MNIKDCVAEAGQHHVIPEAEIQRRFTRAALLVGYDLEVPPDHEQAFIDGLARTLGGIEEELRRKYRRLLMEAFFDIEMLHVLPRKKPSPDGREAVKTMIYGPEGPERRRRQPATARAPN